MIAILAPTARSKVYLQVFKEAGLQFDKILVLSPSLLGDEIGSSPKTKYQLDNLFGEINVAFDFSVSIDELAETCANTVFKVQSRSVNSPAVEHYLRDIDEEAFIVYSGQPGEIVSGEILTASKAQWLHAHGGLLPHYRGSTCCYYSMLALGGIGVSVIQLSNILDSGKLMESGFIKIERLPSLFEMDFVLDNFARASMLLKVLTGFSPITFEPFTLTGPSRMYYVAHPYIRLAATSQKLGCL